MFERRPILGLLILLTICVSIWRISQQEPSIISTDLEYHSNQFQRHRQLSILTTIDGEKSPPTQQLLSGTIQTDHIRNSNVNVNEKHHMNIANNNSNSNRLSSSSINLSLSTYFTKVVNIEALSKFDLNRLINLQNFSFLLNQEPCRNLHASNSFNNYKLYSNNVKYNINSPLVLILVHSAPSNYMKRLLIRETWGSTKSPLIRLIFLLGAVNSTKVKHRLELENKMFSDIVQGNFIDAYRNMTYKHVMALKWYTYYCPNAKFILKIDDDVFVNTPFLMDFLNRKAPQRNFLFCHKQIDSRVKRSYRSKWRVSTKEYRGRYYPPYCPGYAILYSPDVAFNLYQNAQDSPYFWIDDVHITGTLAQKANINITSFYSFVLDKESCMDLISGKKTDDKNSFVFLFTWPDISEEQARKLWKLIENLR